MEELRVPSLNTVNIIVGCQHILMCISSPPNIMWFRAGGMLYHRLCAAFIIACFRDAQAGRLLEKKGECCQTQR